MDRRTAVEGAIASMRMEGFVYTDEELAMFEKLANGEISCDDVRLIADEELNRLRKEHPEFFYKGKK